MKIAFFGTSDKSIPIIRALNEKFELVLCVTKGNTLVGRKKSIRETAVKQWAADNKILLYELTSIKDQKDNLKEQIISLNVDLGVVADFSFMIPETIINSFRLGMINVHFSLLPKLRGASPVQQAILQGLEKTGITYYLLDKGMDTGKILYQSEHSLNGKEKTNQLYSTLFDIASQELMNVIVDYENNKIVPVAQNEDEATYCFSKTNPKTTHILKEDAFINWKEAPKIIEKKIRAFYPWPIAWTYYSQLSSNPNLSDCAELKKVSPDKKIKILEAELTENKLQIKRLQLEGKQITDWKSFVNGYKIS